MRTRDGVARWNRVLLGVIGVGLTAVGGYAVVAHFGRLAWVGADSGVVSSAALPGWVLWAIVGVAGVVGIGCVGWVGVQVPRRVRSVRWRARARESVDTIGIDTAVACAPVATDIESYDGVREAAVRLSGPGSGPGLHLVVTAAPDVDVSALRERIGTHAVPRLRRALELEELPVEIELRLARERSR
ncbi:alkaline shock response membrane anchor protein AmaP [Nocardia macrotermitis]|nr:alkaline shock response membrane anchor protein AmaP [Nocardia macrotermitis]